MIPRLLPIVAIAGLLAACAGDGAPANPGASSDVAPSSPGPANQLSDEMLADVIALAASETGIQPDEISVVTAEAVVWSDGSIGCPQDGMMYTQALVPGYRVILDIAGEHLAFHASDAGEFSPCSNPTEPIDDASLDR